MVMLNYNAAQAGSLCFKGIRWTNDGDRNDFLVLVCTEVWRVRMRMCKELLYRNV